MNGQTRSDIKPGLAVLIVLKQDQGTGKLTKGIIKEILTSPPTHPHGVRVCEQTGEVAWVKEVIR